MLAGKPEPNNYLLPLNWLWKLQLVSPTETIYEVYILLIKKETLKSKHLIKRFKIMGADKRNLNK